MGNGKKGMAGYYWHRFRGRTPVVTIIVLSFIYPFTVSLYTVPFFGSASVTRAAVHDSLLASTSTPEGRLAVFDDAWSTINARYYDRDFHGLDWEAQRTAFRLLTAQATSSQQFYTTLRQMIGSPTFPTTS